MKHVTAAVIVCLAVGTGLALAQETTGDIIGTITSQDGAPLPGVTVTVFDPTRGFERSTSCCPRGTYRLVALQPARYELTARLDGFRTVNRPVRVELGATVTADIQMEIGEFTDAIEVTGAVPLVNTRSTVSGITANTDELNAQLPISRDVARVAMLAPGTIDADPRWAAISDSGSTLTPGQNVPVISGASVAENSYLVNGLNITSVRQMVGSSYIPMEFVDEVQVKTGGYEAEFGRSTGGVINLVTKSGTNTLRGSASVYWKPEDIQEQEPDTYQRNNQGNLSLYRANSSESRRSVEANASLGGALIRDRLFLFGFVRFTDWDRLDMTDPNRARRSEAGDPYWGGKLDWNITSSHRIEATYLSDWTDVDETFFEVESQTGKVGDITGVGYSQRGGDSWVLKYSGMLRNNLLLSAQAGVNPFNRTTRSDADDACPAAYDSRSGNDVRIGCWVTWFPERGSDERTAYRIDADWYLGDHGLRAGVDAETGNSFNDLQYSAGIYYRYFLNETRYPEYPEDQELVRVRQYSQLGSYDVVSNAAYVQDSWTVTPRLTLNLGVRWERFESKNAIGETFMEINDQYAPRIGAIWDISGSGRSKLYASVGLYHLAMSTNPAIAAANSEFFDERWYPLVGGINLDGSPEGLGDELDYILYSDGETPDSRGALDDDFDPMSQSELILGFERLVGTNWTFGVRGVGRRFNEIIEDVSLSQALFLKYGSESEIVDFCHNPESPGFLWCGWELRITNPGTDFNGWYDLDDDGRLDPISFTAEELGYPDPERTYLAVELTARRRFADRWMLFGSYTWSHVYGNYEGMVDSEFLWNDNPRPYLGWRFDIPALMEHSSGDLPNDRRHNLKVYGMYAFDFGLQISGGGWFRSGRPIGGFGWHPSDPWARAAEASAFYNEGEPCPRGCGGRTDNSWSLDLGVKYDWRWLGSDWNVRVDVFNVTNNTGVEVVDEGAETGDVEQPNPSYKLPRYHQMPRQVRLGFGVSF